MPASKTFLQTTPKQIVSLFDVQYRDFRPLQFQSCERPRANSALYNKVFAVILALGF